MEKKIVWEFTNKRKLTEREFADYFERKVLSTIRKYQMPIQKAKSKSIRAKIINQIIQDLPKRKGSVSLENLDDISNRILCMIMHGRQEKLKSLLPKNQPLYFLSDREILLYAKIKKINGELESPNKKLKEINDFIKTIEQKNPDIRHNIANALLKYSFDNLNSVLESPI